MSSGILNKDIIDYWTKNPISTSDLRNKLLNRNLPNPVPSELRGTQFENYFGSIGQVNSFPNPLIGENIPFDEELSLENQGNHQRLTSLLLNHYKGDIEGDGLNQYNYIRPGSFAPTLETEYISYLVSGGDQIQGVMYPTSSNIERFKLLNNSEEIGITNPFSVILRKDIDTSVESFLGIIGKEQLNSSILRTQGVLGVKQDATVPNKYVDGIVDGSTNVKSYRLTETIEPQDLTQQYIQMVEGSTIPYSTLPDAAIGWNEYSVSNGQSNETDALSNTALSTEGRSVEMLLRTSDGQKLILYSNFSQNKYVPNYQDPRIIELLGDNMPDSRYYIGDEKSTNRGDKLTKTFNSEQFNDGEEITTAKTTIESDGKFQWKLDGEEFNPKTLLHKTQQMVNNDSDRIFINQTDKWFKDTVKNKYISRGSNIKKNDSDATSFFRVWTKDDQYSYLNAIKKIGLRFKDESPGSTKTHLSVLQLNGMVKTHPTLADKSAELKKYMLSIENLAWQDNFEDLPDCEKGNNRGRLMWFAPYDLQFDENMSSNWTTTEFIGRGEPLYTYNNAKRSGQLRFKVLVDHPSVINEYRGRQSNLLEKFFSGGKTFEEVLEDFIGLNLIDLNLQKIIENQLNSIKKQFIAKPDSDSLRLSAFFEEESSDYDKDLPENADFEKNVVVLSSLLKNSKQLTIKVKGRRGKYINSAAKIAARNNPLKKELSLKRADAIRDYLKEKGITVGGDRAVNDNDFKIINKSDNSAASLEIGGEIQDRRADIVVNFDNNKLNGEILESAKLEGLIDLNKIQITPDECNYFDMIDETFPTYFKTISEKIKYFHPAFHSSTPESLNSRMTFLQQCMRQGPSINDSDANIRPQNLAFGRPPVCILRIGDFFHSKVVINSLSFNYAGGGSNPQWDLNPEGIGVQPMMVDVNLSIDIVGGHSMVGPINRLQNALSFNFYANTEMYDLRSDSLKKNGDEYEVLNAPYPEPKSFKGANQTETSDGDKKDADTDEEKNSEGFLNKIKEFASDKKDMLQAKKSKKNAFKEAKKAGINITDDVASF